jgi:hypothetical protein
LANSSCCSLNNPDQQSQARSRPQFLNNHVMEFWTEGLDGLIVSRGMEPVGEKNDF